MKIENGVPIPENRGREKGELRLALESMEPGDSVLSTERGANTTRTVVGYASKATGFKFTTRAEGNGLRVWRVN